MHPRFRPEKLIDALLALAQERRDVPESPVELLVDRYATTAPERLPESYAATVLVTWSFETLVERHSFDTTLDDHRQLCRTPEGVVIEKAVLLSNRGGKPKRQRRMEEFFPRLG